MSMPMNRPASGEAALLTIVVRPAAVRGQGRVDCLGHVNYTADRQ
jgi:hypothetical protein